MANFGDANDAYNFDMKKAAADYQKILAVEPLARFGYVLLGMIFYFYTKNHKPTCIDPQELAVWFDNQPKRFRYRVVNAARIYATAVVESDSEWSCAPADKLH